MNFHLDGRTLLAAALLATSLGFAGCGDDDNKTPVQPGDSTQYGETKSLGSGTARSWVRLNASGRPEAIGFVLTETALTGLPAVGESETVLPLPAAASATAFKEIGINWNPEGHPPGFYLLPHFDFHFYMITEAQRDQITAVGADTIKVARMPDAQYIPAGYIPTPGGVPRMGAHWVDPSSPEFQGETFTKTFIYGFYDAKLIFMEPMLTMAWLQSRPDVAEALKVPTTWPTPGLYYPTHLAIKYDAAAREYTVTLDQMVRS